MMACPNCGRTGMATHHDRQVFCDECLPVQRELRAHRSTISMMMKRRDMYNEEIDEDKLEAARSDYEDAKSELKEIKERVD